MRETPFSAAQQTVEELKHSWVTTDDAQYGFQVLGIAAG